MNERHQARIQADLGLAAARRGQFDKAASALEKAIEVDPAALEVHINLGAVYGHQGRHAAARDCFERALALDQGCAEAYSNLGGVLQELGALDEAKAACCRALELDAGNSTAAFNLHALIYDEHNPAPAVEALELALNADPEDERTRLFFGILLEQRGQGAKAERQFAQLPLDEAGYHPGLDAWAYVKAKRGPKTQLVAPTVTTLQLALKQATLDGLVLEFGVRYGTTLQLIAAASHQAVHGFDSFQGLPENWHDEPAGSYSTHGVQPQAGENAVLHAGWFEDTLPGFVADHPGFVRFLHVDCDLYSSAATIFRHLGPRIQAGSIIVFDDYFLNPHWREDEFKAFQEAVAEYGWQYEYIAFSLFAKQAAVRILSV